MGTLGGAIIFIFVLVGVFADALAPYHFDEQDVVIRLQGASAEHLLGTDHVGRDFLSRNIYGARISLLVGLAATSVTVIVAILVGAVSGYAGGRLDLTVQRFVDAWMAIPGLLLLLTIMSITGQGVVQIIVVLGVTSGISNSRIIRGRLLGSKRMCILRLPRRWVPHVGEFLSVISCPIFCRLPSSSSASLSAA